MDSDEEYISLNSSSEEGEDGKSYSIEDVLAEKKTAEGKTLWLVSWVDYGPEYHLWLPEENFDDPETLQDWERKKQRIKEGLIKPFDWRSWERRKELHDKQLAQAKAIRQEKREIKRAQPGVVRRHGRWGYSKRQRREPGRSRSLSDETYSEGDDSPLSPLSSDAIKSANRPVKRQIVNISDSDDDVPLAILALSRKSPGQNEQSSGLSSVFALPFRSSQSQSPFPPDLASAAALRNKQSAKITPKELKAGPKDSADNSKTSMFPVTSLLPQSSRSNTGRPILNLIATTMATTAKTTIATPVSATTKTTAKPKATAVRSSIPKSEILFNIPKRVINKKLRAMSNKADPPVAKDFYTKASRYYKQTPRDRDNRRPDISSMTIMDIATAAQRTSVPGLRGGTQSVPNTPLAPFRPSNGSLAPTTERVAPSHIDTYGFDGISDKGKGVANDINNTNIETGANQPFEEVSHEEESSLFVSDNNQDVTMEDASVATAGPTNCIPGTNQNQDLTWSIRAPQAPPDSLLDSHGLAPHNPPILPQPKTVANDTPLNVHELEKLMEHFSEAGSKLVRDVLVDHKTSEVQKKMLRVVFDSPDAFSSSKSMTDAQKESLFSTIVRFMPSANGRIAPRKGRTTAEPSTDPRRRRDSTKTIELQETTNSALPKSIQRFLFAEFYDQFMSQKPYSKVQAIQVFNDKLGIDWRKMTRSDKDTINVYLLYPVGKVILELKALKEFLHANRVRLFTSDRAPDWPTFEQAAKDYIWLREPGSNIQLKGPFDPRKHVRVFNGVDSVVLIHESFTIFDLAPLIKRLRNPRLHIYNITLGEEYLGSNGVNIKPNPGVTELSKDGEHLLLTDSVILKRPADVLKLMEWFGDKLNTGDHVRWKIYARPQLTTWLGELIVTSMEREETSNLSNIYREIFAWIHKLEPREEKNYRYEGDWLLKSYSPIESDSIIPGYDYEVGVDENRKNLDADLEYNDRILIKWFASVVHANMSRIRFFSVLVEGSDKFGLEMAHQFNRIHFWPTGRFMDTFVNSDLLLKTHSMKEQRKTTSARATATT